MKKSIPETDRGPSGARSIESEEQPFSVNDEASSPVATIDFHSPEFNRIDEIDDDRINYRSFETLDGIVTADMKHREEMQRRRFPEKSGDDHSAEAPDVQPVEFEQLPDLSPLTIVSRGRVLIISENLQQACDCAEHLRRNHCQATICHTGRAVKSPLLRHHATFTVVEAQTLSVEGSFGGFSGTAAGEEGPAQPLSGISGQVSDFFDTVLDLQASSSYAGSLLPRGYLAPGEDSSQLVDTMAELSSLQGTFSKPRFLHHEVNRCIHERVKNFSCLRCQEACPVSAIHCERGEVVIDHYRCQGCGTCALLCPTSALEMHAPERAELLVELLSGRAGDEETLLRDSWLRLEDHLADPGNKRFLAIDEPGRLGAEMLLTLLAGSTGKLVIDVEAHRPASLKEALKGEVELARTILQGLAHSAERLQLRFISAGDEKTIPWSQEMQTGIQDSVHTPARRPRPIDVDGARGTLLRRAAALLAADSQATAEPVALPSPSPYGRVTIADGCSLCMSCVTVCPGSALQADGDRPIITLIESHCSQCGLCAHICPENAVDLEPRLLLDDRVEEAVVVREATPFACIECGTIFATADMVRRMEEKLTGHWMYRSAKEARRLKMCSVCRIQDTFTEMEAQ